MFTPRNRQIQRQRSPGIGTASSKSCLLLLSLATCLTLGSLHGEDWPRWRGPRGDGTWRGPKLAHSWPQGGLGRQWVQSVGSGYSGVSVAAGQVITMDRLTKPEELERVLCFDAKTGDLLWIHQYPVEYGDLPYGSGLRSAPTIFQERVYALGALGNLSCLSAEDGNLIVVRVWTDRSDTILASGFLVARRGHTRAVCRLGSFPVAQDGPRFGRHGTEAGT